MRPLVSLGSSLANVNKFNRHTRAHTQFLVARFSSPQHSHVHMNIESNHISSTIVSASDYDGSTVKNIPRTIHALRKLRRKNDFEIFCLLPGSAPKKMTMGGLVDRHPNADGNGRKFKSVWCELAHIVNEYCFRNIHSASVRIELFNGYWWNCCNIIPRKKHISLFRLRCVRCFWVVTNVIHLSSTKVPWFVATFFFHLPQYEMSWFWQLPSIVSVRIDRNLRLESIMKKAHTTVRMDLCYCHWHPPFARSTCLCNHVFGSNVKFLWTYWRLRDCECRQAGTVGWKITFVRREGLTWKAGMTPSFSISANFNQKQSSTPPPLHPPSMIDMIFG